MSEVESEKSVSYNEIITVLIEAIKEQQQQIETVKEENATLTSELQVLKEETKQILKVVKPLRNLNNIKKNNLIMYLRNITFALSP